MKNFLNVALVAILASISTTGYGLSVSVATASCKQNLNQSQITNCGNINAPLTINNSGGGTVVFAPTTCYITAGMSASQMAQCSAAAA